MLRSITICADLTRDIQKIFVYPANKNRKAVSGWLYSFFYDFQPVSRSDSPLRAETAYKEWFCRLNAKLVKLLAKSWINGCFRFCTRWQKDACSGSIRRLKEKKF